MSQAEELLNSSNYTTTSTTVEPHIVIGSNRVITVPDVLKRIAVQHDHNIETVTFDCPRYWDEHDLSTMKICINYLRADGEPGSFEVENITVDETDNAIMHFTWTITRNVSDVNGYISFLVCARTTDEDGNELNHWNSELCVDCYVSAGLDCHEPIAANYPDVITQILTKLGTVSDIQEGLDQLSEQTSELSEQINDLKNSENYVDDDGYLVLGSTTTVDSDGYINL